METKAKRKSYNWEKSLFETNKSHYFGQDSGVVNAVLDCSHNHLKITTKLYNNYHLESSEVYLNRSPKDIQKKPP